MGIGLLRDILTAHETWKSPIYLQTHQPVRWGPSERWKNAAFAVFGTTASAGYVLGGGWGAGIVERRVEWEWIFWRAAVVVAYAVASWAVIPERGGDECETGGRDCLLGQCGRGCWVGFGLVVLK